MKKTKYALLSCVATLALSAVFFAGSTFAWLTVQKSNWNNSIATGTLIMEATRYAEGTDGPKVTDGDTTYTFTDEGQSLNKDFKLTATAMAPGESRAQRITIKNSGSLDGVLNLRFITDQGNTITDQLTFKLAEVKEDKVDGGTVMTELPTADSPLTAEIKAGETRTYLLVVSVKPDRMITPDGHFSATIHPVIEQQSNSTESGQ